MNNQVNYFVNPTLLFQRNTSAVTNLTHNKALSGKKQHLVTGFRKEWIELLFRLTIITIAVKNYSNPWNWLAVPLALDKKRRKNIGEHRLYKLAQVNDTFFWGLYTPGWNRTSLAFQNFISQEMNPIVPVKRENCYEWDNLNKKETLSSETLKTIVAKLQAEGVSQIHLSGGEPLLKMELIADILKNAKKETDFWILTSGFKLTDENAKKLKTSGIKGLMISLDHYLPEKHNAFRGFKDAYHWVETGVQNAIHNDLAVALSLCASRDFVTRENLMRYASLAKEMGVAFIQILEPRAVGHYKDSEVDLTETQLQILEDFYLEMNYDPKFKTFPLVSYHGYYQRKSGCYGAGNRSLYIDTDGDLNACPFCQKKSGNVLNDNLQEALLQLKNNGCQQFNQSLD